MKKGEAYERWLHPIPDLLSVPILKFPRSFYRTMPTTSVLTDVSAGWYATNLYPENTPMALLHIHLHRKQKTRA